MNTSVLPLIRKQLPSAAITAQQLILVQSMSSLPSGLVFYQDFNFRMNCHLSLRELREILEYGI